MAWSSMNQPLNVCLHSKDDRWSPPGVLWTTWTWPYHIPGSANSLAFWLSAQYQHCYGEGDDWHQRKTNKIPSGTKWGKTGVVFVTVNVSTPTARSDYGVSICTASLFFFSNSPRVVKWTEVLPRCRVGKEGKSQKSLVCWHSCSSTLTSFTRAVLLY